MVIVPSPILLACRRLQSEVAVAGVGAAVLGTVSTVIGIACGMLVGQAIEGTVLPLVIGFGAYFSIAFLIMLWAERGRTRLPASAQG